MPLPKPKSNFFNNSFFIFIARFFPSMANLAVVIWYSRQLSPELYGSYQHFWIQLNVIAPLACFGIHVLVITYSPGLVRGILGRIRPIHFALYGIWVITLSTVFSLLQDQSLGISFLVPFLFLFCFSVSVILESLLIVYRNYTSLIAINTIYSIAYWLVHFCLLRQGFSLQALFTWLLVIMAARLCFFAGFVIPKLRQKDEHTGYVDIARTKNLWLHLGLYDVLQILFSWIDKFIISLVMTASVSAIYFNGSQNIPVLPLLLSAAGSAVLMQLAVGNKDDEQGSIIQLMNQSGRVLSCIVFPVFFYLFIFRDTLIVTLLSDKYITAVPVFAISILVLPVKAYSFTTVLQRMHKGAIINAGAVIDLLLACVLMYPLYLLFGLPGVALSFVITTYLQAAFYLVYSARLLEVSPLELIPSGNWIWKLIVFSSLFIAIRYVGDHFFTGKISLILGGVMMMAAIVVSLLLEFDKNKENGGIA